ncbi:MAG: TIGR00266 family protein [Halodesulfurarchaeum sp.]
MRSDISHPENHPLLVVGLDRGEAITAEAGAMVMTAGAVDIESTGGRNSGVFSSLRGDTDDKESIRLVRFVADGGSGQVQLAPPLPGDVVRVPVRDQSVYVVQAGSFLGAHDGVILDSTADTQQPLRGNEGLSFLELSGTGPSFLAGYGAVETHTLSGSDSLRIDTGHVVAFTADVSYDLETVSGLKSNVFQDEAVISTFEGPGTVWIQTRSHEAHLAWLKPYVREG